jgi:glycerate-2-kinase
VRIRGEKLLVYREIIRLDHYDSIFVAGAGKASGAMAEALEEILGDRLEGGLVVVPSGQKPPRLSRVRPAVAPHPIPDESSVRAAKELVNLVQELGERDLLICAISGGGSALLSLPAGALTIEGKGRVAQLLMNAGATIVELNSVRKHLSAIKGGWLAKHSSAGRILGLLISDVVEDRLDTIASGPISPDSTTFSDAIGILKKYNVWDSIPSAAVDVLCNGAQGAIPETPKAGDPCFRKVSHHILWNNRTACTSAQRYLRSKGINTQILSSSVTGEARYLGSFVGSLAREIGTLDEPFRKPCAFVLGGETTVTVTGSGRGGRNQECMMTCAREIRNLRGAAVASIGTDGIDGTTDAAGAVVDGMTLSRSESLNLELDELLVQNDSYRFFQPLKDLVMTGRTNTNVNDVALAVLL